MEFWGVEVKSGEPLSVKPGDGMVLHLSQANLGEVKKLHGSESVCLFVNVDGKKLVLGTLISDKLPQQQFDLIFDKDFELSHNWKNGNVYFYGFKAQNPIADDDDDQESDSDEDSPPTFKEPETVVKPEKQAGSEKSDFAKSSASDKKVKIKEPHKDVKAKEDESSDEYMGSSDDDLSDEDMDSSDGEDEDESNETPKKVESGKKWLAESEKAPASDKNKKAKLETPQKTSGKKSSVHVATPYPLKQAKAAANKPNQPTPKSAGSHTCKSCNRTLVLKLLWIPVQRLNIVLESDQYTLYRELKCLCIAYSPGLLISFLWFT